MKKLLVVDDDPNLRTVLQQSLESCGYDVVSAKDGFAALETLKSQKFALMITDLQMPGMKGIELLEKAKAEYPDLGCLVITAYGTVETAVEAMQKGAYDFITKPFSISHIESRIERYFDYVNLQKENQSLKRQLFYHKKLKKLIGQSKAMENILYHIEIVAHSDATVFIRGDSGTGKELIAQAIHDGSSRADKPFLKINCAAVPETLFESTLFGHEKGSFSGAYKTQKGIFEECDGGTLLLDEISEIPFSMQAKLLRVLQEMKIVRVGSTIEIPIDVRIIATSNRDLNEMIRNREFREDLFFRLNVFPVNVPSLNERREDIPLLAEHFLKLFQRKYHYDKKVISEEAMDMLMSQNWRGNIREFEHTLERAILISGKDEEVQTRHFIIEHGQDEDDSDFDFGTNIPTLAEMEKKLIFAALKKVDNQKSKAAEMLDINVRTLRNKLHLYQSEEPELEKEE